MSVDTLYKRVAMLPVCEYDNPIQWIKEQSEVLGEPSMTALTFLVDSFFEKLSKLTRNKDTEIPTLSRVLYKVLDLYEDEDKYSILDDYRHSDKFVLFIAEEIEAILGYNTQLWLLFLPQYFREWEIFEDNLDREKDYE